MIQFLYNAMKWYLYKLEITMKKTLDVPVSSFVLCVHCGKCDNSAAHIILWMECGYVSIEFWINPWATDLVWSHRYTVYLLGSDIDDDLSEKDMWKNCDHMIKVACMTDSLQPWPNCFGKYAKTWNHNHTCNIYRSVCPPFPLSMLQNGKRQPCVKWKFFFPWMGKMHIEWCSPTLSTKAVDS